jgi:hypothetical protein
MSKIIIKGSMYKDKNARLRTVVSRFADNFEDSAQYKYLIIWSKLLIIEGDSKISLEKKTVIGDDEKKSLTKKCSYKSFFVFEIQMLENFIKIDSTLLS